jgi:hypothetical protein
MPDAPADGNLYARQNRAWLQTLARTGGTVSGQLVLAGPPVDAKDAVTKEYADNRDAEEY